MVDVRGDVLRPPHGTTPAAAFFKYRKKMIMMFQMLIHFCIFTITRLIQVYCMELSAI